MQISIRPAVTADRASIEAASRATWDDHRGRQPYAFPENGWDMLLKRDHEFAFWSGTGQPVGESGNLFVADADGVVVGFVLLSWHLRDDAPDAPNGTVIDIWVQSDWRKKGVGRNLVDFAKIMANAADWDNLTAQVWNGAPSVGLFESADFTPHHVTWRYGPGRPAKLIQPKAKKPATKDNTWKWPVVVVIIALIVVIASQQ